MAVEEFEEGRILTLSVRIVHGLLSSYGHIVVLQTSGLAEALRELGCSVSLVSGFFSPEHSTSRVDLTVFTFELLSMRGNRHWPSVRESMAAWSAKSSLTVGFVQDDFTFSAETENLIRSGILDFLLSPHAFDPDRVQFLYPNLSREKVIFVRNGYLDRRVLEAFKARPTRFTRQADGPVFGRSSKLDARFGSLGYHKSQALDSLRAELESRDVPCDFETSQESRLRGFEWYERVQASRAVVNPVGGSDLIDRYGFRSWARNKLWLEPILSATWFESAINKSPLALPNFGPRVLEALALGTPQVLTNIPGLIERVFPGMSPWRHFIPLGQRLENLTEVADSLKNPVLLESISTEGEAYVDAHPEFFFSHLARQLVALISTANPPQTPQDDNKKEEQSTEDDSTSPSEIKLLHEALLRVAQIVPITASAGEYSQALEQEQRGLSSVSERLAHRLGTLARKLQNGEMTPLAAHYLPLLYSNSSLVLRDIDKIMEP